MEGIMIREISNLERRGEERRGDGREGQARLWG